MGGGAKGDTLARRPKLAAALKAAKRLKDDDYGRAPIIVAKLDRPLSRCAAIAVEGVGVFSRPWRTCPRSRWIIADERSTVRSPGKRALSRDNPTLVARVQRLRLEYLAAIRTTAPLHVRHDERTDRAVIAVPDAHMAMVILTGLYLLSIEQVTRRDVKPAGNCLHQLIADDGKAIHIAAAG